MCRPFSGGAGWLVDDVPGMRARGPRPARAQSGPGAHRPPTADNSGREPRDDPTPPSDILLIENLPDPVMGDGPISASAGPARLGPAANRAARLLRRRRYLASAYTLAGGGDLSHLRRLTAGDGSCQRGVAEAGVGRLSRTSLDRECKVCHTRRAPAPARPLRRTPITHYRSRPERVALSGRRGKARVLPDQIEQQWSHWRTYAPPLVCHSRPGQAVFAPG